MEFYKENTYFSIEQHTGNILSSYDHFHDLFEFYYLAKGTATYLVNDKIYNLVKGDIVVIPPNTLHKTIFSKDTKRERILLYLDKRFLQSITAGQTILPDKPRFYHTNDNPRLESIFKTMLDEFNDKKNIIYLEALTCELLILLQRTEQNIAHTNEKNDLSNIIPGVLKFISSNYSSDITLDGVSKKFYVNSSYLSRLFKQHTGFTFCNYLNQYRVKEANILLTETTKQITEIAFECGFNSSNNFCKCYKKIMGISPLSYRKRVIQKTQH